MHISSGAVIYREEKNEIHILIMFRRATGTYHLPKGTQQPGEDLETTAKREIKEETGYEVTLKEYLGVLLSSFTKEGKVIQKETHYFKAELASPLQTSHDDEHDEIMFVPVGAAKDFLEKNGAHRLGYETEQEIVEVFLSSLV